MFKTYLQSIKVSGTYVIISKEWSQDFQLKKKLMPNNY
jgi:hypothetical protein